MWTQGGHYRRQICAGTNLFTCTSKATTDRSSTFSNGRQAKLQFRFWIGRLRLTLQSISDPDNAGARSAEVQVAATSPPAPPRSRPPTARLPSAAPPASSSGPPAGSECLRSPLGGCEARTPASAGRPEAGAEQRRIAATATPPSPTTRGHADAAASREGSGSRRPGSPLPEPACWAGSPPGARPPADSEGPQAGAATRPAGGGAHFAGLSPVGRASPPAVAARPARDASGPRRELEAPAGEHGASPVRDELFEGGVCGAAGGAGAALAAWVRSETAGELGPEAAGRLARRLLEQDLTSVGLLLRLDQDRLERAAGSIGAFVALHHALQRAAPGEVAPSRTRACARTLFSTHAWTRAHTHTPGPAVGPVI